MQQHAVATAHTATPSIRKEHVLGTKEYADGIQSYLPGGEQSVEISPICILIIPNYTSSIPISLNLQP